jgi:hypothetical protein
MGKGRFVYGESLEGKIGDQTFCDFVTILIVKFEGCPVHMMASVNVY